MIITQYRKEVSYMKVSTSYPRILTDETIRENVSHGNTKYPFAFYLEDIWQFDFHSIDWHWHAEVEFVYIEKGYATILAGNNRYTLTPGNGIFINNQVIHRFESTESTIIPNIVFSPLILAPKESLIYEKYVYPILSASIDCQIFTPDIHWQKEIIDILCSIFLLQKGAKPCELQTVQLLLKLWQVMYENIETISPKLNNKAIHRTRLDYRLCCNTYTKIIKALLLLRNSHKSSLLVKAAY